MLNDVFQEVAAFLDDKDLAKTMLVCRDWKRMANEDMVWKQRIPRDWTPFDVSGPVTNKDMYRHYAQFERFFQRMKQQLELVDAFSPMSGDIIVLLILAMTVLPALAAFLYLCYLFATLTSPRQLVYGVLSMHSFGRLVCTSLVHVGLKSKDPHVRLFCQEMIDRGLVETTRTSRVVVGIMMQLVLSLHWSHSSGVGSLAFAAVSVGLAKQHVWSDQLVTLAVAVDSLFRAHWTWAGLVIVLSGVVMLRHLSFKHLIQYILWNGRRDMLAKVASALFNILVVYACVWVLVLLNYEEFRQVHCVASALVLSSFVLYPFISQCVRSLQTRSPLNSVQRDKVLLQTGARLVQGVLVMQAVAIVGTALSLNGQDLTQESAPSSRVFTVACLVFLLLVAQLRLARACAEQFMMWMAWTRFVAQKSVYDRVQEEFFEHSSLLKILD